jgi:23S rRNA (guanosine2251-2'-O)-methyltransferase
MVAVGNVAACVGDLQNEGYWVTVLDMNAERSLWETPLAGRCVLVIGAEGEGVSHLVRQRSDESLRIPICGGTGSLNAGVAVALGMFHWAREWRKDFGMRS